MQEGGRKVRIIEGDVIKEKEVEAGVCEDVILLPLKIEELMTQEIQEKAKTQVLP